MPADQPDLDAAVQACRDFASNVGPTCACVSCQRRRSVAVVLDALDRLRAELGTEQAMHRAWRKRAEEAEALTIAHAGRNPFHGIEGLKPVDRADLVEYEAAMKEAIPEMIEEVRKREQLAHESRQRFMG